MRKLSQKIIFSAFFIAMSFSAGLLVSSCLESPSLSDFLKDDDIKEAMAITRIDLSSASDSGLIAGNKRITNLDRSKYYMIKTETSEEQEDENEKIVIVPKSIKFGFINKDGEEEPAANEDGEFRQDALLEIGKVTGGVITGLENAKTYGDEDAVPPIPTTHTKYTVKSAAAAPTGGLVYYTLTTPFDPNNLPNNKKSFTSRLPAPAENNVYYINFKSALSSDKNKLAILRIMVTPSAKPKLIYPDNDTESFFKLEGEGTTTDYLFIEYSEEEFVINSFRLLRVAIGGKVPDKPEPDDMFEVTFNIPDLGEEFDLGEDLNTGNKLTINQNDIQNGFTIEINCDYPGFDSATIKWWYDGDVISTGNSIMISETENPYYMSEGTHYFTVEAKINTILFTKTFIIEVQLDD